MKQDVQIITPKNGDTGGVVSFFEWVFTVIAFPWSWIICLIISTYPVDECVIGFGAIALGSS